MAAKIGPINVTLSLNKVGDSVDDITYADLLSFTNIANGQRAMESGGKVDRYLAIDGDAAGFGSRTVFCEKQ